MSKKFSITIIEAPDQNQRENPNNQFSNSEPMTFAQKVDYVKNIDMTNNKQQTALEWLSLLFSIVFFLIFAYDIENDRDFYTWLWLFNAMIFYTNYLKFNWNK